MSNDVVTGPHDGGIGSAPADGVLDRPIRVLVADDQALVRSGFALMLRQYADLVVCGQARDGAEAVLLAGSVRPDVVLMDVRMPGIDGIAATRTLMAAPDPPAILILTTYDIDEYVVEALRAGAAGYLLKDVEPADLVAAVRSAAGGDMPMAPSVIRRLVDEFLTRTPPSTSSSASSTTAQAPAHPGLASLSAREREVMVLLAHGMTNAEVAAELVVSTATVKTHVAAVLAKLGLRDRIQVVILAYEARLIQPGGIGTSAG